jgi:hypothetical protein
LERRQIQKPNSKQFYQANDIVVGAVIEVFGSKFTLHDADEYAFNHMVIISLFFSHFFRKLMLGTSQCLTLNLFRENWRKQLEK